MALSDQELEQLGRARLLLENPTLAARITDLVGRPLEKTFSVLPDRTLAQIQQIVRSALEQGLRFAVGTMGQGAVRSSSDRLHALATMTTGAAGGFFGLAGLAIELPVTTVIMLRSIGDIARSEGHDLDAPAVRLACLEVFALGAPSEADDAAEAGYYAARATMATLVSDAVQHLAEHGLTRSGAPGLVRLLERIAARFGVVVQEKAVLEWVPVIGALSGALINSVFMHHFQCTARGHFIVTRLESVHGVEVVRAAYESC